MHHPVRPVAGRPNPLACLIVIDRYAPAARRCLACEDSTQGRLALG
jgi:hypothetical protein